MSIENLEKINFGIPSISSNGDQFASGFVNHPNIKRRRTEDYEESTSYAGKVTTMVYSDTRGYPPTRTFLSIRHNSCVYHTEDWKPRGCAMYLPLTEDIMINTRNIEQISFENDQFFLADEKGNYVGAKPGNAIHLWRFDPGTRKLFISRSLLFLKEQDYQHVHYQLETL